MKKEFNTLAAIFGTIISYMFGGFSAILQILLYFAILDYITGMASAYKNKELSSKIGFRGIIKKVVMFLICSLAYKMDLLLNLNNFLYSGVIIWYCANEALSIVENAIELDLPVPQKLKDAINSINQED